MQQNRRDHILSLSAALTGASLFGACAAKPPITDIETSLLPEAGTGLIVVKDGLRILEDVSGFAGGLDVNENVSRRAFTADSSFRVASMSKVVTLLTARHMAQAGVIDLDADINTGMGISLRHPDHPDMPITLQHLLSHRSGISDPDIYWMAAAGNIRDLLSPDIFKGGRPGGWFEYANINYGIAASVLEAASGTRFDILTQRYVLGPLGLDAGFNWMGVSPKKRASSASLYRLVDGGFVVQVDGPDILTGTDPVLFGQTPDFDVSDYTPGRNGTLFSPQGGLRASLNDLLVIAQHLQNWPELHDIDWRYNGTNGQDENGHFVSFGPGLYVYPPELSPMPGHLMVGHHGEAYGMYGGLWHMPDINAQIVHAVTATPQPPRPYHPGPPAMARESRALLDKAAQALKL